MVPTPMYGMRPSYAPVSVYTAPPTQPAQPAPPPQLSEQELKQVSKGKENYKIIYPIKSTL
jgi:hypothetical protein